MFRVKEQTIVVTGGGLRIALPVAEDGRRRSVYWEPDGYHYARCVGQVERVGKRWYAFQNGRQVAAGRTAKDAALLLFGRFRREGA